MGTTVRARPTAGKRGRGSEAASTRGPEREDERDAQYDLLTAALIGVVIGAGATMLFRRGPRGIRPIAPMLRAAGKSAKWAGARSLEGARWAGDRGEELWDAIPRDEIAGQVRHYASAARDAINDVVEDELRDLRKSIRRQRKRIGV